MNPFRSIRYYAGVARLGYLAGKRDRKANSLMRLDRRVRRVQHRVRHG